jgi:uncharacterized membrane protein/thiol-disulfide isomerase/thioredoxin
MLMTRGLWMVSLLAALWVGLPAPATANQAAEPVVRAVFFFSPGCPHCHDVMRDHLPPLMQRHGAALQIVAVNVDTREGQAMYQAVASHFRLPRQRMGVPALVVGDQILVGAWEIPSQFPGIVDTGLAAGGIDWPAIATVRSYLSLQGLSAEPSVQLEEWMLAGAAAGGGPPAVELLGAGPAPLSESVRARFMRDPTANTLAVVVLLGMVVVLWLAVAQVVRPRRRLADWPDWVVPALAAAGLGVALYLAYVEVTGTQAVCGPVGDCNTVQLSPYAYIFGIPVGVLGVIGYVAMAGVWLVARVGPGALRPRAALTVWFMAAGGVLFSIYLTFLEPFVIGATCIWCLNSAIIMTLILLATTPAAQRSRLTGVATAAPAGRGGAVALHGRASSRRSRVA